MIQYSSTKATTGGTSGLKRGWIQKALTKQKQKLGMFLNCIVGRWKVNPPRKQQTNNEHRNESFPAHQYLG